MGDDSDYDSDDDSDEDSEQIDVYWYDADHDDHLDFVKRLINPDKNEDDVLPPPGGLQDADEIKAAKDAAKCYLRFPTK